MSDGRARSHPLGAMVWGAVALVAEALHLAAFSAVFDRRDAGLPGGPWEPIVWPAAGVALVAFVVSLVLLVRWNRAPGRRTHATLPTVER